MKKKKCYGNTPEYFRARRRRLGEPLKAKERERWHKRKNTEYEGRHRLSRTLTAKLLGISMKDIPQELGEAKIRQIKANQKMRGTTMRKPKKLQSMTDYVAALNDLATGVMNGEDTKAAFDVVNKGFNTLARAAMVSLAYQKHYGRKTDFIKALGR